MQTAKRNGSIDLIKFLLALALVFFHGRAIIENLSGGIMPRGASAVEAFYIIAGFFMAHTAISKETPAFSYIWKRYKEIFAQHAFSFVCAFIATCIISGFAFLPNLKNIIGLGIRSIPEFFLFSPLAGLQFSLAGINGIEWYLSAMLLGMAIIYPFLKKFKKNYCFYIGPLVFLFLSGYLFQTLGSYRGTYDMTGFFCNGLLRAVAMMSLGTTVYWAVKEAKGRISTKTAGRVGVTVAAIICWVLSFYYLNSFLPKTYEFTIVYFMAGGTFFSMLGTSYLCRPLSNRFVTYLGKLSLPMFLNQGWIRKLLLHYDLGSSVGYAESQLIFLGLVLVMSVICVELTDRIRKAIRTRKAKKECTE